MLLGSVLKTVCVMNVGESVLEERGMSVCEEEGVQIWEGSCVRMWMNYT